MSGRPYLCGETVRITFETKLASAYPDGTAWVSIPGDMGSELHATLDLTDKGLTVERMLPADGDAKPGDVWRGASGGLWFAQTVDTDDSADEPYVVLIPGETSRARGYSLDDLVGVNRVHGPMVLIWRHVADEKPSGGAE